MKQIIIEDKIKDKTVRCIFIFSGYSEKDYKEDFEEFIRFQKEKNPRGEFVDYHLHHITHFDYIPYNYFMDYGSKLFSKAIFYLLKQRPEFILSDELNIQLKFKRIKNWDYSFESSEANLNEENACFYVAGAYFINNIVAPYFYLKSMEFSSVMRYFLHELTHYVDNVNKILDLEETYEKPNKNDMSDMKNKKIRKMNIIGRKSAYGIYCAYFSLFNLRAEGLAEFVTRSESPEIDIQKKAIYLYNENLKKLAFMRYQKDASLFYDNEIGYNNPTFSGENAVGRNMCLIIALWVAKEMKLKFCVRIGNEKFSGYEFKDLDKILSKEDIIYISKLDEKVIHEAVSRIRQTNHYYFLKIYEKACDHLGISDKNRAMTTRRFYHLVDGAKKASKARNRRLVKRDGFVYVESDIPLPDLQKI